MVVLMDEILRLKKRAHERHVWLSKHVFSRRWPEVMKDLKEINAKIKELMEEGHEK